MFGILLPGIRSTAGMAKFTGIRSLLMLGFVAAAFLAVVCHAAEFPVSFDANFVVTSDGNHAQILDGGQVVNLALVEYSSNRSFGLWSTLQPLIVCVIELWRCSEKFQSSDHNKVAGIEQEWVAIPHKSPYSTKDLSAWKSLPWGKPCVGNVQLLHSHQKARTCSDLSASTSSSPLAILQAPLPLSS